RDPAERVAAGHRQRVVADCGGDPHGGEVELPGPGGSRQGKLGAATLPRATVPEPGLVDGRISRRGDTRDDTRLQSAWRWIERRPRPAAGGRRAMSAAAPVPLARAAAGSALLTVRDLGIEFPRAGRGAVRAVEGIDLDVHAGEIV